MSRSKQRATAQNRKPDELTPDELREIRAYRSRMQREWWNRQTPEERRERRQRYDLNRAKRLLKQLEESTAESIDLTDYKP